MPISHLAAKMQSNKEFLNKAHASYIPAWASILQNDDYSALFWKQIIRMDEHCSHYFWVTYIWFRLVGLSGLVIFKRPSSSILWIYNLLKLTLSFNPICSIISINDLGSEQNSRINFIFASTLEDILEFLDGFSWWVFLMGFLDGFSPYPQAK